jgi:hypothetical protein
VLKEGKITQLALCRTVNGLRENQKNQFVWEPLKNLKSGRFYGYMFNFYRLSFLSFIINF